jgi:uncharacterized protein YecT (DUF1311 family)
MKSTFLTLFLFCSLFSFAQPDPQEITPERLKKIKTEAEKETAEYMRKLDTTKLIHEEIVFERETYLLGLIREKKTDLDYTTYGMNKATRDWADGHDSLMNKYYNRLLKLLSPEDKKTLIAAQKSWLAYRDAEGQLMGMMMKEEYSGGGTIQSNIATNNYCLLIVERTNTIFNYYSTIVKTRLP